MGIRSKITLHLILIISLACAGLYGLAWYVIRDSFNNIEQDKFRTNLERVRQGLEIQITGIKSKIGDWSQWDDSYEFARRPNSQFIRSNVNGPAADAMRINGIYILNRKGDAFLAHFRNALDEPIDEQDFQFIENWMTQNRSLILSEPENAGAKSYFVKSPHRIAIIVAGHILTSELKGPSMGLMIFTRFIDAETLRSVSELSQLPIHLHSKSQDNDSADLAEGDGEMKLVSDDLAEGKYVIYDNNGNAIDAIKFYADRPIYRQAEKTLDYLLGAFVILLLLLGTSIALLLDRLILSRIFKIRELLNRLERSEEGAPVVETHRDEIGALSVAVSEAFLSLKRTQKQLLHAQRFESLGIMAGGIAHEINNPLTIIGGFAEQMNAHLESGSADTVKMKKYSVTIQKTTERIAKIVRGLKSFSRDAHNDAPISKRVGEVIEDGLSLCQQQLMNRGIRLELGPITPNIWISCRPSEIGQVILNLVSNAIDAIEALEDRWIQIEVKNLQSKIHIVITDSGSGIPKDIREKIMNPFFTTKPIGKGTGLGLSITLGIIEAHHGKFWVDESNPHTCFVIELPTVPSPEVQQQNAS